MLDIVFSIISQSMLPIIGVSYIYIEIKKGRLENIGSQYKANINNTLRDINIEMSVLERSTAGIIANNRDLTDQLRVMRKENSILQKENRSLSVNLITFIDNYKNLKNLVNEESLKK